MLRLLQHQRAHFISEIKLWRDGDRVGNPHSRYRDGHVGAPPDREQRCGKHMYRERNKRNKKADEYGARHGVAIEMPEIRIVQPASKHAQGRMVAQGFWRWNQAI